MEATRDITGSRIFGQGHAGQAHVVAHRMLDEGRHHEGHRVLGDWLQGRRGTGSEWVHLQWHMLVFELAVGDWDDAHARCLAHVVPAAREADDAPTDAPAALWRLALSAPRPVTLPWSVVKANAVARLEKPTSCWTRLHDLLALAGAGDVDAIERWLVDFTARSSEDDVLRRMGAALIAYARGEWLDAAHAFGAALPALPSLGGSRAQNELFHDIHRAALSRSAANDVSPAPALEHAVGFH